LMVAMDHYELSQWDRPWVDKIIFHVEACSDPAPIISTIKSWKKKVFLASNPATPLSAIEPFIPQVDGLLFMTVEPGKNGAPFIPAMLDKIKATRSRHLKADIEVDGGVSDQTLLPLLSSGANGFAVGSFLDDKHIEDRLLTLIGLVESYEGKMAS